MGGPLLLDTGQATTVHAMANSMHEYYCLFAAGHAAMLALALPHMVRRRYTVGRQVDASATGGSPSSSWRPWGKQASAPASLGSNDSTVSALSDLAAPAWGWPPISDFTVEFLSNVSDPR